MKHQRIQEAMKLLQKQQRRRNYFMQIYSFINSREEGQEPQTTAAYKSY